MAGLTQNQLWPYPLPGEVMTRQHIQDLAEAMTASMTMTDVERVAALQRPRGVLGHSGNQSFTVATTAYMSWNTDHLDAWYLGGRAVTSTQGPTPPAGLYMFTFYGQISATSAAIGTYSRWDIDFEVGGTRRAKRSLAPAQMALRLSAPIRVNGSQQVRVRIGATGSTGGSTISINRNLDEASPRLAWTKIATG